MQLIGQKFKLGGITWTVWRHEGEDIWGEDHGGNKEKGYQMTCGPIKLWNIKQWLENKK